MALSRRLQNAARQSADHATDRARAQGPWPFSTDVTSLAAGAAQDGRAVVSVTIRDSEVAVNGYPDTYTPGVGDRVLCQYDQGGQLFIIMRNSGAP